MVPGMVEQGGENINIMADAGDIDLRRSTLQVEQKRIFLNLRENVRGRYLRIAEVTGSNRSTIIIPSSGLGQFRQLLDEFIESDSAVAMGQQAMLPDSKFMPLMGGDMGGMGMDKKKKKRPSKKMDSSMPGGVDNGEGQAPPDGNEDQRVFVGNLSWATNFQTLKDHFAGCGEVTKADVFTERSGRSRGCGIVEFATLEQAQNAKISMNNTELDGRTIFVREDRG